MKVVKILNRLKQDGKVVAYTVKDSTGINFQ